MKGLPYFRWWPADAETDSTYAAMTWAERGFYHWCLNYSWINNGLPGDVQQIAKAARMSSREFAKLWECVGKCFTNVDGSYRNRRQEEERSHATTKSERATAAVRTRYERSTDVGDKSYERTTNDLPRALARESESESDTKSETHAHTEPPVRAVLPVIKSALKPARAADLNGQTSQRFDEFWSRYPRQQHRDAACHEWLSVVTVESEPQVFACLGRYLASDEVSRGAVANPEKWLMEQYRDGWAGTWPGIAPRAQDSRESPTQAAIRKAKEAQNGTR